MNILLTLIVLLLCFAAIGIGLLIKNKVLHRGCGLSPEDCACQREGKDPAACDKETSRKEP